MMNAQDVRLDDWRRILSGQEPAAFYLELLLRAAVVYLILLVAMRLLGKRMSSQLSRTELAAVVSLAAAVGVPLLASDRGLVPGAAVALVVVITGRAVARLACRSARIEKATQGFLTILVDDGTLQLQAMKNSRITRERLFAQLRSERIHHLGLVERLYLEANGTFTMLREPSPRPGLSVIPEWDEEFRHELRGREDHPVCWRCGEHRQSREASARCPNCGRACWVEAVE